MATPLHTPEGRGYDSVLCYYSHKNDFWTMQSDQSSCSPAPIDLWQANKSVSPSGSPAYRLNGSMYEEQLFEQRLLRIVAQHDPTTSPLFLFYAAHVGHYPLQVPQADFEVG